MKGIKIDNPKVINGYSAFIYIDETPLWYFFRYKNFEVKVVRQVHQSDHVHIMLKSDPFYKDIVEISLDDLSDVGRFVDFIQAECHKLKLV